MAKKTADKTNETKPVNTPSEPPSIDSLQWTEYVLSLLSEDEKIQGNPTTDGLRRVFETALNCALIESTSDVVQSPCPSNEKRATVVHSISYILKDLPDDSQFNTVTVNGAADVYWGNCDKVFRNHPVAVAETRAEGRALRRALRLRKVLAAEEVVENIEDDISMDNVTKITNNQLNFIDVIAKRIDVNVLEVIKSLGIDEKDIKNILHEDAVRIIKNMSELQTNLDNIPESTKGYINHWSKI